MTKEELLQESSYYSLICQARRKRWKQEKKQTKAEKDIRTKQWCTFYRRNLNVYIEERLRIKLRPFQHIMIYLMSISETFWSICSRGLSKTFICATFAVAWANLYPKSEIIIVSSVIKQANLIITEKVEGELMSLSPVLKKMHEDGMIYFKDENDCRCMYFWNGSSIKVLPEAESSRGNRSTFLIAEEARLLTKNKYDSIFREMLRPRNADYRAILEYQGDEYADKAKEVFLTSAYFKSSWIWTAFKKCVTSCFNDKYDNYNFFAGDIYVAIYHGIKTWTEFRKSKSSSDELSFRMETLNEMIGEADGAYYTLEMFQKNQILKKSLHPPTNEEFDAGVDKQNRKKQDNEYRILSVDLAFSEDAVGKKEEADRCALEVLSVICRKNGTVERRLEYIESMGGGDEQAVHQRIRELYWDLQCDRVCVDVNGGGILYWSMLTSPWQHPTRQNWNPHGFVLCEEPGMQVLSDGVLNELRQRQVDPEGIPCMIPMKATAEMNSNMWKSLWKSLNNGSLTFLEDELQVTREIDESKSLRLTSEERMRYLLPYVQTSLLINEGINLSATWKDNGILSLSQPRTGHKDRMSALQYANWIADKIENNHAISQNQEVFNIDDFAGVLI